MVLPVIIEAAINGFSTKDANPRLPVTPEEIAADALACLEAGAAIVHPHCTPFGGPDEDVAERYLAGFRPVWAERPDALLYPSVNLGPDGIGFGHLAPMARQGLRMGVLDPGSINSGRIGPDGVPTGSAVYTNTYDRIGELMALHAELGLGPNLAIYEPGFLRTALCWWRAGKLPAGAMMKFYLTDDDEARAPFGLPVKASSVDVYVELLGDCDVPWAVSAIGGDVVASGAARRALELGGHLHVGLEFYGGDRTPTNAELVGEAVALCAEVGRPVASCAQAAELLGLP